MNANKISNCRSRSPSAWYNKTIYRQGISNNVCASFDFNTPLDTSDIKSGIDMV